MRCQYNASLSSLPNGNAECPALLLRELESEIMNRIFRVVASITALISSLVMPVASFAEDWLLEVPDVPFRYGGPDSIQTYTPLASASQSWRLCVSFPHLKDAYWLNVNYGMVDQVRQLGVGLQMFDAGGYPNVDRQITQIEQCLLSEPSALIVGTVSFNRLSDTIMKAATRMPVLATVNDIADAGISAKAGVSWYSMGKIVGDYMAQRHPAGTPSVQVAWFPGPAVAGWVPFVHEGFLAGIDGSAIELLATRWGDTGKEIQRTLVQEVLETMPQVDYLIGNALAAEAAISVVRALGFEQRIGIVSTYLTHGVFRGIKRDRILAAPTDFPVLQGRLSVDQAVRILEGKEFVAHAGPGIVLVHGGNLEQLDLSQALAPPSFLPTFRVGVGEDDKLRE